MSARFTIRRTLPQINYNQLLSLQPSSHPAENINRKWRKSSYILVMKRRRHFHWREKSFSHLQDFNRTQHAYEQISSRSNLVCPVCEALTAFLFQESDISPHCALLRFKTGYSNCEIRELQNLLYHSKWRKILCVTRTTDVSEEPPAHDPEWKYLLFYPVEVETRIRSLIL